MNPKQLQRDFEDALELLNQCARYSESMREQGHGGTFVTTKGHTLKHLLECWNNK